MPFKVYSLDRPARDFEKLTISDSAKGLTSNKIGEGCFITVEDADIRCRWDGTDPDTSTGHLILNGGSLVLNNPGDVTNLRMIRDAATDAIIQVTHF